MSDHLITTAAIPTLCRHCRTWVLTAHSGGLLVHADPVPLDEREELTALLDDRPTFNIVTERYRHSVYLEYRSSIHIKTQRKHSVVTTHKCGHIIGTPPPIPPPTPPAKKPVGDKPPF